MQLIRATAVPSLQLYVRCFQQRVATILNEDILYPIAARPEQLLEFYLEQPYVVRDRQCGAQERTPRAVVVGPVTSYRSDLILRGRFDVFTIQFQSSGFHRLFGVPMACLVDRAFDARGVLGREIAEIEEQLAETATFQDCVRVASDFLLRRLDEGREPDAVAAIANQICPGQGTFLVAEAAAYAGLSVRQFERNFIENVGLPPKQYSRIVRFSAALGAKMTAPKQPWTEIAQDYGYYDQMHLVKDFTRFTGESPTAFGKRTTRLFESWA